LYKISSPITTSLTERSGWYVGSLLAAWVTFGTRNYDSNCAWRIPTLVQVALPIFIFVGYLMAEESPHWLASKGRIEEARSFLVRCHAGGDEDSTLVAFELEEITSTLALEQQVKAETSYLDMLRTKGNRHRTLISITIGIFAQWNGVVSTSQLSLPSFTSIIEWFISMFRQKLSMSENIAHS
jgi:hypothetical protein